MPAAAAIAARRRRGAVPGLALMLVMLLTGCGGGGGDGSGETTARATGTTADPGGSHAVLRVPSQYPTVQRAVDAARAGDLVLIAPGTYHEAVVVGPRSREIVIRGLDRNRVVLDGRDRLGDGIAVHADGVVVENLTVRRYLVNGVVWSPAPDGGSGDDEAGEYGEYGAAGDGDQLQGWRGSYLTAADNGLYGVYAFGAEHGRFDNVYASGQPDSGVYVGRCKPCHALVRDSVAVRNHVGYEATNASGDVVVTRNRWSGNRVGVQLNSLRKEAAFPQEGSLLAGNEIARNQARDAPRGSAGFGAGVVVNGGVGNIVRDNAISGHAGVGVLVLDSDDATAARNTVRGNQLRGNRVDLALQSRDGRTHGSCFAANAGASSGAPSTLPPRLQAVTAGACGRSVAIARATLRLLPSPPQVDYRTVPLPPAQRSMPGAADAPPRPAVGRPERERG